MWWLEQWDHRVAVRCAEVANVLLDVISFFCLWMDYWFFVCLWMDYYVSYPFCLCMVCYWFIERFFWERVNYSWQMLKLDFLICRTRKTRSAVSRRHYQKAVHSQIYQIIRHAVSLSLWIVFSQNRSWTLKDFFCSVDFSCSMYLSSSYSLFCVVSTTVHVCFCCFLIVIDG